jgi:hypothetical protein
MEQQWQEAGYYDETEARSVVWHLGPCGDDDGDGGVYERRKWFAQGAM